MHKASIQIQWQLIHLVTSIASLNTWACKLKLDAGNGWMQGRYLESIHHVIKNVPLPIRYFVISHVQRAVTGETIENLLILNHDDQHVVQGVPACSNIAWDEADPLVVSVASLPPGRKCDGGGVDNSKSESTNLLTNKYCTKASKVNTHARDHRFCSIYLL